MPFSPSKRPFGWLAPAVAAVCAALMMAAPSASAAPTESVLYAFMGNASDGSFPLAGLIADGAGNLYGTTAEGGASDAGVVFKLAPNGAGGYTESVLYAFTGGSDGGGPAAGLIADGAGNLYGTTADGGAAGAGLVFKLAPNGAGGYTESVLYAFTGGASDGAVPLAGLIAVWRRQPLRHDRIGRHDRRRGVCRRGLQAGAQRRRRLHRVGALRL